MLRTDKSAINDIKLEAGETIEARFVRISPQKKIEFGFAVSPALRKLLKLPDSNAATLAFDIYGCTEIGS